jgi:hypothetical protein
MNKMDTTLCTRRIEKRFVCAEYYVGDIIFGSINQELGEEFGEMI